MATNQLYPPTRTVADTQHAQTQAAEPIGFLFNIGHGHHTQFLNFQECFPQEQAKRAIWIPVIGEYSDSLLDRIPLPMSVRYRLNQTWRVYHSVAQQPRWQALFLATMQVSMLPLLRRHRCYAYIDFTWSLKRELSPWYDHMYSKNVALQQFRERVSAALHRSCAGIFVMSNWAGQGAMRDYRLDASRIHLSLPGANLQRWHYVERPPVAAGEPVRILMVGGEFVRKGGTLLLDWAQQTKARGWEMDIVTWRNHLPAWIDARLGDRTDDSPRSCSLAPELPNVRIHTGLKANSSGLQHLFEQAQIFCMPTLADFSQIASLEAMATGLPVIVSAVGGIPELITDGETGLLVRRGDPADLAQKLELLINDADVRQRIGRAARQSCEDYFNVQRQVNEILAVFDKQ